MATDSEESITLVEIRCIKLPPTTVIAVYAVLQGHRAGL